MKDFKSYTPDDKNNKNNKQTVNGVHDVQSAVEFAQTVSKAMNGKNEGQLLRTIIAEAERGKREGRLTNADLDNFYNSLAPMVDGIKRKKLKEVITRLKNI